VYKKFREHKEIVAGTYGWFKFQDKVAESIVRKDFLQYWGIIGLLVLFVGFVVNRNGGATGFLIIWTIFALLGISVVVWYARWCSFFIISSTGVLGPSAGSYRRTRILWGRLASINIRLDQFSCLYDSDLEELETEQLSFNNLWGMNNFTESSYLESMESSFEDELFDANFLVLSSVSFEEISIFLPFDVEEKNILIEKILRGLVWYRTEYVL